MSPFSLHMECYDSAEWQANFYHGPCEPCTIRSNDDDPDLPGLDVELAQARDDYLNCMILCETAYCQSICRQQYDEAVIEIKAKYNN